MQGELPAPCRLFSLDWVQGGSLERASVRGANLEEGRCPGKAHFSLWKKPQMLGGGSQPFNWTPGHRWRPTAAWRRFKKNKNPYFWGRHRKLSQRISAKKSGSNYFKALANTAQIRCIMWIYSISTVMIKCGTVAPHYPMASPSPKCTAWEACSSAALNFSLASLDSPGSFQRKKQGQWLIPSRRIDYSTLTQGCRSQFLPLPQWRPGVRRPSHNLCHPCLTSSAMLAPLLHPAGILFPTCALQSKLAPFMLQFLVSTRGILVEYSSWVDWRGNKTLFFMLLLLVHKANNWSHSILMESLLL